MRPPNMKRPGGAVGAQPGRKSNGSLRRRTDTKHSTDRPFEVNIVAFDRAQRWGAFATAEAADAEIAKLRRIGFHAVRVSA